MGAPGEPQRARPRLSRRLGRAASATAWLGVVVPVHVVARMLGARPLGAPRRGWRRREGRAPGRPASGWRGGVALRRLVVIGLALLVVAQVATRPDPGPPQVAGAPFWPAAFEGQPRARDLWEQSATLPEHVSDAELGWRNAPQATAELVSIRDGVRTTRAPTGPPDAVVWLVGGSTAYGLGQRDDHTIASRLVAEAEADGRSVEVVNLGVSGYVAWQEALLVRRALAAGTLPTPDVVVAYHRSNDLNTVCRRSAEGLDPDEPLAGIDVSDRYGHLPPEPVRHPVPCTADPGAAAALAAQLQEATDELRRVAAEAGSEVVEAWQPDVWTVAATEAHRRTFARLGLDEAERQRMGALVERARRLVDPAPLDLSRALDGVASTTLFDFNHTNEAGAAAVAAALWPRVALALDPEPT